MWWLYTSAIQARVDRTSRSSQILVATCTLYLHVARFMGPLLTDHNCYLYYFLSICLVSCIDNFVATTVGTCPLVGLHSDSALPYIDTQPGATSSRL